MTYKEEQEKKRQAQREHVKEVTGLLDTALSVIFDGHSDIMAEWKNNTQHALHDERIMVKDFADNDFSAYNEEFAEFRYNTLLKNFKTILAHAKNYLDTVLKNRAAVAKARKAQEIDDDEPAVIHTISGGAELKPAPRIVRDVSARSIFWRIPCLDNQYTVKDYDERRRNFLSNDAYFCGVYHETNGAAIDDEIRQLSRKSPLKAGPLRALYEITRVIFYNYGAKRADGCCFGFSPFLPETQEETQAKEKIMDVYRICFENAKHVTELDENAQ